MEATSTTPTFVPLSGKSFIDQSSSDSASLVLPSTYTLTVEDPITNGQGVSDHVDEIPIIDVSLLISDDPEEIRKLGRACEEWGFFLAINHGVSEGLMMRMEDACSDFFNMAEDEKRVYLGKDLSDPIFYGTSSNHSYGNVLYWRDFLKIKVHPTFHSPAQPQGFRDVLEEYCEKARELAGQLMKGISETLGFEKTYISEAMDMDRGSELFVANLYPPCPDPENAIGLPAHTDHGLITLLMQNGIHGLQILHNGKWIQVEGIPGALFVNTCDQIEIFTNGKYKSVVHKAVVNGSITRMSMVVSFGPSLDTFIGPSERLLCHENSAAAYNGRTYGEYSHLQMWPDRREDNPRSIENHAKKWCRSCNSYMKHDEPSLK